MSFGTGMPSYVCVDNRKTKHVATYVSRSCLSRYCHRHIQTRVVMLTPRTEEALVSWAGEAHLMHITHVPHILWSLFVFIPIDVVDSTQTISTFSLVYFCMT